MRQKLFYAGLYFSEGAPIGFVWWALPAILAEQGVSLSQITALTALASLPWSFKFCFSPLIEFLAFRGLSLRTQLLCFQILMGLSALGFAPMIQTQNFKFLALFLGVHASVAACQDICIDALAIQSVDESMLGSLNGYMQAGMLVGRSLFGGAALFIVHALGLPLLIYLLVGSIWTAALILLFSPAGAVKTQAQGDFFKQIWQLFRSQRIWLLFGLAFFSGYVFEGLGGTASATLVKLGISSTVRSLLYALGVPFLMLSGALIGGWLSDRHERAKMLSLFWGLTALSGLMVSLSFDYFATLLPVVLSLVSLYFCIGLLTAVLYAYLMQYTHKAMAAFEFSLLMAGTNLCESTATYLTGQIAPHYGFVISSCLLIGLSLLTPLFLKRIEAQIK